MARTIVLVRHGKAERAGIDRPDEERSLAPGAAEALARSYPTTFSLLGGIAEPALVWVSPAVRARQTAEQVTAALDAAHVAHAAPEPHECLWEQDGSAFLAELAATPANATVICVGHIPFMQGALARLTGVDLAFAPGAAAAVSTAELEPGGGTLLWFVQGPRVR